MQKQVTPHATEFDHDVGTLRHQYRIGVKLGKAFIGMTAFYILAGLLNGENILQQTQLMEYSRARTVCVALAKPLATLSRVTGFNKPRLWLQHRLKGQ